MSKKAGTISRLGQILLHLSRLSLAVSILGKESTLHLISSPLARANAEEHIRQLRRQLTLLERNS